MNSSESEYPFLAGSVSHTWAGRTVHFPSQTVQQTVEICVIPDSLRGEVVRTYLNLQSLRFSSESLTGYYQTRPRPVTRTIGGLQFYRTIWGGRDDRWGDTKGVVYSAQDGDHVVLIAGVGYANEDFETVAFATAVVLSFQKQESQPATE